jgi:excisionase family DNA binding protein
MLLTVDEAAVLLRVNEATVRRQIRKGEIKARVLGKVIRIPLDQFSDVLDVAKVVVEVQRLAKIREDAVKKVTPTIGVKASK